MMLVNFPWLTCFEDGDADAAAAAAAAAAATASAASPTIPDGYVSKERVEEIVKERLGRDRDNVRGENKKLLAQLESLQTSGMSAEDRETYETQIEELRTSSLTKEEQADREKKKFQLKSQEELEVANTASKVWEGRFHEMFINSAINTAADDVEVLPDSKKFVAAFLKPDTHLVENTDEDGKPTGTYTAKVKMAGKDKEGKDAIFDFTIKEALEYMKDNPEEYGRVFKGISGGLGGTTLTPGKQADMSKLAKENPAAYMAIRKKERLAASSTRI